MRTILAALMAVFLCLPVAQAIEGAAEVPCAETIELYRALEDAKAKRLTTALVDSGLLLEIFELSDGTWLLFMTDVNGTTCRLFVGPYIESWRPGPSY